MKSIRLIAALCVVSLFASAPLRAGDDQGKAKEKAAAECKCEKDKDGKECGKDKPCCCKEDDHGKGEKKEKDAADHEKK